MNSLHLSIPGGRYIDIYWVHFQCPVSVYELVHNTILKRVKEVLVLGAMWRRGDLEGLEKTLSWELIWLWNKGEYFQSAQSRLMACK